VPDAVWAQAARHHTEPQLAALVVAIAAINAFNRVNVATRQITGAFVAASSKRPPEPPPETVEFGDLHVFVGPQFVITVRHGEASGLYRVREALEGRRRRPHVSPLRSPPLLRLSALSRACGW
jgi:hypothetical protein